MVNDDDVQSTQVAIFDRLSERVERLLEKFGQPDSLLAHGDFSVYGDYWGHPQVRVSVHDLSFLRPDIVGSLREIVQEFPGWEIVVVVAVRGHYDEWPDMGLYVRPHEIVDGLQRQYFPEEFRSFQYEGSRPGTEFD